MTRQIFFSGLARLLPFLANDKANTLASLFRRTTGNSSAKWQGYLTHYERHFASRRHEPISLLEIGVQGGGSLEIWATYFKQATHIVGCDIDPACGELGFSDPRIQVVIGDINDDQTMQGIQAQSASFDIIIDDGSHQSQDIIKSFLNLFPCLSDGGVYLIEDLHCSYWDSYGGGLFHPQSAISFFKKIVDTVNRPVWGVSVDENQFFSAFKSVIEQRIELDNWEFLAHIHSIEFANSMCIIQKKAPSKNDTGQLLLSGQDALNQTSAHHYLATELVVPDQSANILALPSQPGSTTDEPLLRAYEELARLKTQNTQLTTQYYESTKKFYEESVKVQALELQLKTLQAQNLKHPEQN
jgi:hypothetical protein